jgi:hypothetical protein
MITDAFNAALESAKTRRGDAHSAVAAAAIRAGCDAADALVCEQLVQTLAEARAGAIAAAKPDAALAADTELLKARITFEIAVSRAAASTAKHVAAVADLHQAEAAVTEAARAVLDLEMTDLAAKFSEAFDGALALGNELLALSLRDQKPTPMGAVSTLPLEVERALDRLPRPNPLNMPMNVLRGFGRYSGAWEQRMRELTADETISDDADADADVECDSPPACDVGSLTRAVACSDFLATAGPVSGDPKNGVGCEA